MIGYVFSHFRHRFSRAMGIIGSMTLGVTLYVALTALGNGYQQAARAPLSGVGANLLITRPAAGESAVNQRTRGMRLPFGSTPFSPGSVDSVADIDGVDNASGALEVWDFGAGRYTIIIGLDTTQIEVGPGRILQEGLISGRIFQSDELRSVILDRHYAAFFKLKPGDFTVIGGERFQVTGIVDQAGSSQSAAANMFIPLKQALRLSNPIGGYVNQIYVRIGDAEKTDFIIAEITDKLGNVSIMSQQSILQVMSGINRITTRFSGVAGMLALIGGGLLAWMALTGLIAERRREIGIMKSVGWRSADVEKSFMIEFLILILLGILVGFALGSALARLVSLLPMPDFTMSQPLPGLEAVTPVPEKLQATAELTELLPAILLMAGSSILIGWFAIHRFTQVKPTRLFKDS